MPSVFIFYDPCTSACHSLPFLSGKFLRDDMKICPFTHAPVCRHDKFLMLSEDEHRSAQLELILCVFSSYKELFLQLLTVCTDILCKPPEEKLPNALNQLNQAAFVSLKPALAHA